ncbi:MAG: hypothetical protein IT369_14075 [Candidatus Latescibacteria bacterium]|nr:hypothetical protein [Candidatus Latescibacterota bacterium]
MDIQRLQPGISGAPAASARLTRAIADAARNAGASRAGSDRALPPIAARQVTSDPKLQSVLSSEETQALEQLFSAFRSASESSKAATYSGRGTAPRLPPLGGGRPGQLIDVVG